MDKMKTQLKNCFSFVENNKISSRLSQVKCGPFIKKVQTSFLDKNSSNSFSDSSNNFQNGKSKKSNLFRSDKVRIKHTKTKVHFLNERRPQERSKTILPQTEINSILFKKLKTFDDNYSSTNTFNFYNVKFNFTINAFDKSSEEKEEEKNEKDTKSQSRKNEMKKLFAIKGEKCSYSKKFGKFFGFSAVTFKNCKKNNEDKLRININSISNENLAKSKHDFFAIYDGHRGDFTSKYLKDNFQPILLSQNNLETDPQQALFNTFAEIELTFKENVFNCKSSPFDKSGSCALVLLNVGSELYVGNVGDSRCVLSMDNGGYISQLSVDHKPYKENEKKRIEANGGYIKKIVENEVGFESTTQYLNIQDIARVMPCGLSVSRTIGDIDTKYKIFGGKENVISSIPDIFSVTIKSNFDFIVLGCDGIFDVLTNKDVANITYSTLKNAIINESEYDFFLNDVCTNIIYSTIDKGSKDNLSVIFIAFESIYNLYLNGDIEQIDKNLRKIKVDYECDELCKFVKKWNNYLGNFDKVVDSKQDVKSKKKRNSLGCFCFKK